MRWAMGRHFTTPTLPLRPRIAYAHLVGCDMSALALILLPNRKQRCHHYLFLLLLPVKQQAAHLLAAKPKPKQRSQNLDGGCRDDPFLPKTNPLLRRRPTERVVGQFLSQECLYMRRKTQAASVLLAQRATTPAPLKAIQYLQRERILEPGGAAIAAFLRTTRGLCTRACGEILGESVSILGDSSGVHCQAEHQDEEDEESRCSDCCMLYALGFCFDATPFEIALRFFLGRFRMPGEAQKISRILTSFARSYYRDNPRSFR